MIFTNPVFPMVAALAVGRCAHPGRGVHSVGKGIFFGKIYELACFKAMKSAFLASSVQPTFL
jgi:hypothetical protein